MRTLVNGCLAVLLAGLATVAGVSPAIAYTGYPVPPVVAPSSSLTIEAATAAQGAYAAGAASTTATTAAGGVRLWSTVGQVASKVGGAAMVGMAGFQVGFEGTSLIMQAAGWAEPGTTGWDGLSAIVFPNTTAEGYIPNKDAVAGAPGFDGGVSTMTGVARYGTNGGNNKYTAADITVSVNPPVTLNGTGGTYSREDVIGTLSVDSTPQTFARVQYWVWNSSGNLVQSGQGTIGQAGYQTLRQMYYGPGTAFDYRVIGLSMEQTWDKGDYPATPQVIYRTVGADGRFDGGDVDPLRAWETRWTCANGITGLFQRSAQFRESSGSIPEYPAPGGCGSSWVNHVEVWEIPVKADQGTAEKVWEYDPAQGPQEFGKSYPQCTDGSCRLELYRVDGTDQHQLSCFANPELCVNWMQDPARADNYVCKYAGAVVDLSECNVYAPTFNVMSGADVQTEGGTQKAADTYPYGDPKTGAATTTTPGTGTGTDPSTTPRDENCPPPFSWTSLVNPWWYYKSTVCALQEMFVPTNSTAQIARINTAINTTTPAVWAGELSGMFDINVSAGGCLGPGLDLTRLGITRTVYPFSACDPPMSTAAPIVKAIATVLIVVFGSMAAVRGLGSGFGWKPSAGGDG